MGTLHYALHTGARPIGLSEFVDAVRATCPPRFTQKGTMRHRRVGIAVSGGVDSMALAYLCSKVRKFTPDFMVSDNPVNGFRGMVVDHGLREGSGKEAHAVYESLQGMGFSADFIRIRWSKYLDGYNHPSELPNIESVARSLRYEKLGDMCAFRRLASLFLAHHEDDQYETVLMRLLRGHGSLGLRGMKKAHDIPECEGMFHAHQSGYVDDQMREFPYYKDTPSARDRRHLNRALKADIRRLVADADDETALNEVDLEDFYHGSKTTILEPNEIPIEDGGVMIYRPLLEFSKDRLIATCLENNVPWWEDSTNQDPTLTMRNAVRKLYKGHTLPKALQKPAILALSKKCEWRAQAREAEADRLLRRTIIHDFEPCAGTVIVQFPKFESAITRRHSRSPLPRQARLSRRKEIAALLLRKILMLVSPESAPPNLTTLENHVWRLFPSLADPGNAFQTGEPKAFRIYGVFLVPIMSKRTAKMADSDHLQQLTWHLSRAPYTSYQPLPRVRTPYWAMQGRNATLAMSTSMPWSLWDGRYWVHVEHRLPYRVVIMPFLAAHSKPFRALLPAASRARLDTFLKRYAPAKVRYTLPAIYLEEDLDLDRPMRDVVPRGAYPNPIAWEYRDGVGDGRGADTGVGTDGERRDRSQHPHVPDPSKMKLLALPTLNVQLPGLDDWLDCEIRYRKADRGTLRNAGTWDRRSFRASAKKRPVVRYAASVFSKLGRERGRRGVVRPRMAARKIGINKLEA
ncbi:adenine nucleotide alpha hydrolases-like protein [Annulohypoxylon bovei var. microspora]|nr:adenine nucleotide alpha hydrolases-like protein [Annulohypoxylon bovei var. microspora]